MLQYSIHSLVEPLLDAALVVAERGHEAVVRLLVERNDVEAESKDEDGRTSLFWAAKKGHHAIVMLLETKLDIVHTPTSSKGPMRMVSLRFRQHPLPKARNELSKFHFPVPDLSDVLIMTEPPQSES